MMDDGRRSSYNRDYERKGFAMNTHGFSKPEVNMLCRGLTTRYGLVCWPRANKNKWVLVISGYDHTKMMDLIKHYVIPSMYHKFPGFTDWS